MGLTIRCVEVVRVDRIVRVGMGLRDRECLPRFFDIRLWSQLLALALGRRVSI